MRIRATGQPENPEGSRLSAKPRARTAYKLAENGDQSCRERYTYDGDEKFEDCEKVEHFGKWL
jgi:hypothetical protein